MYVPYGTLVWHMTYVTCDVFRALEGSSIVLSCQANGLPMPNITWKDKNGKQIEIDPQQQGRFSQKTLGDLLIRSVEAEEDEGQFVCTASNVYGQVSTVTRLQVIRKAQANNATEVQYNACLQIESEPIFVVVSFIPH